MHRKRSGDARSLCRKARFRLLPVGKGPFIVMYSSGRVMRVCALHEARSISEDLRSTYAAKDVAPPPSPSHYRGSLLSLSAAPEHLLPLLSVLPSPALLSSSCKSLFSRRTRSRVSPLARTRPREWRTRAQCLYGNQFRFIRDALITVSVRSQTASR